MVMKEFHTLSFLANIYDFYAKTHNDGPKKDPLHPLWLRFTSHILVDCCCIFSYNYTNIPKRFGKNSPNFVMDRVKE
jgi:hypothetical protein